MTATTANEDVEAAPPAGSSRRGVPYLVACGFYALFAIRASGEVAGKRTFPLFDDAMISMTYARNLARGHGLVWDANGPRVEGITNVLWTLVMAIPHLFGVSDQYSGLVIVILGAGVLCVCAALAAAIVARIAPDRPTAATAATWLVLFCYPLLYWTLRGMEVGLMTALLLGAVLLALRYSESARRTDLVGLAVVIAAGCLTRMDFLIFIPVIAVFLAFVGVRGARWAGVATVLVAAAATTVAQEIGRFVYYGRWVPNTYVLKIEHTALTDRLDRGIRSAVFTLLVSGAAALVFAGVAYWKRRSPAVLLLIGCAAMTAVYDMYVGGDAWEWMRYANRYLTPGLVVLLCAAAIGVFDFVTLLARPWVWRAVAVTLVVAGAFVVLRILPGGFTLFKLPIVEEPRAQRLGPLLLIAMVLVGRPGSRLAASPKRFAVLLVFGLAIAVNLAPMTYWSRYGAMYSDFDLNAARTGVEAASITTPDATVAVISVGNAIYYGHRTGVDILGKSDRRVAAGPQRPEFGFFPGHMKWNYAITLTDERPDLVADRWLVSCADRQAFVDNGYLEVWPRVQPGQRDSEFPYFALEGSPHVRWDRLVVRNRADSAKEVLGTC